MNTPECPENEPETPQETRAKKSALINIRVPVDYAWNLRQQALARDISISDLVREKLLIADNLLSSTPSVQIKKKEETISSQVEQKTEKKAEKDAPRSVVSGKCAHGFRIVNGRTSCPNCKQ